MPAQKSPYMTSPCVPQCTPKDQALLHQSVRSVCADNIRVGTASRKGPGALVTTVDTTNAPEVKTVTLTRRQKGLTVAFDEPFTVVVPAVVAGDVFTFVVVTDPAAADSFKIQASGTDTFQWTAITGLTHSGTPDTLVVYAKTGSVVTLVGYVPATATLATPATPAQWVVSSDIQSM